MKDLRLTEIWIYPIKSLGGIRLKSSRVIGKGLKYDRRLMLVDEEGVFMTQRTHPAMALIKMSLEQEHLVASKQDESIAIPVSYPCDNLPIQTKVFDDPVTVHEVSAQYSRWFSDRLGLNCKLVCFPEENPRLVDPKYTVSQDHVSLADGYPFLIIGEQSLADLNSRLKQPLPMNRFRPNLVFSGGIAYEEDDWRDFAIGKNRFLGVKPCGRCAITTINQETAEKGKEPLATLATYRRAGEKIKFGQNVIAIDHDEIFEGDEITTG